MRFLDFRAGLTWALKSPRRGSTRVSSVRRVRRARFQKAATPEKRIWFKEPKWSTVLVAPARHVLPTPPLLLVLGPRAGPVEGPGSAGSTEIGDWQICKGLWR